MKRALSRPAMERSGRAWSSSWRCSSRGVSSSPGPRATPASSGSSPSRTSSPTATGARCSPPTGNASRCSASRPWLMSTRSRMGRPTCSSCARPLPPTRGCSKWLRRRGFAPRSSRRPVTQRPMSRAGRPRTRSSRWRTGWACSSSVRTGRGWCPHPLPSARRSSRRTHRQAGSASPVRAATSPRRS